VKTFQNSTLLNPHCPKCQDLCDQNLQILIQISRDEIERSFSIPPFTAFLADEYVLAHLWIWFYLRLIDALGQLLPYMLVSLESYYYTGYGSQVDVLVERQYMAGKLPFCNKFLVFGAQLSAGV
jgi:hypothetical protein